MVNYKKKDMNDQEFIESLGVWTIRANTTAEILNTLQYRSIHDFGCGKGYLRKVLKKKAYQGYDSVRLFDGVILVDLNEDFPSIDWDENQIAVCIGLLEYISNIDRLFDEFNMCFPAVLFTYADKEKIDHVVPEVELLSKEAMIETVKKHYREVTFLKDYHYHNFFLAEHVK